MATNNSTNDDVIFGNAELRSAIITSIFGYFQVSVFIFLNIFWNLFLIVPAIYTVIKETYKKQSLSYPPNCNPIGVMLGYLIGMVCSYTLLGRINKQTGQIVYSSETGYYLGTPEVATTIPTLINVVTTCTASLGFICASAAHKAYAYSKPRILSFTAFINQDDACSKTNIDPEEVTRLNLVTPKAELNLW